MRSPSINAAATIVDRGAGKGIYRWARPIAHRTPLSAAALAIGASGELQWGDRSSALRLGSEARCLCHGGALFLVRESGGV